MFLEKRLTGRRIYSTRFAARGDWAVFFVLFLFYSMAGIVLADEPVNLQGLIKEGLQSNPDVEAARRALEAARYKIPQSSALPDPTAGVTVMANGMLVTANGPQDESYQFEQMIPFPGKLIERRKIARAEADLEEAHLNAAEQDLTLKISESYYDLFAVQSSLAVMDEVKILMESFSHLAESRYASQGGSQGDVAKAQTEVSSILKEIFDLQQQKESLEVFLNTLLARTSEEPWPALSEPPLPAGIPEMDSVIRSASENNTELTGANAMVNRQKHAKALARYEFAPDITVGMQYIKIGRGMSASPDAGEDALMIPVKFTIPLWGNRVIPAAREASAQLKAAEGRLQNMRNVTAYDVKNIYYQIIASRKTVDLYRNALIPQSELALRSDRAGYESGSMDILKLIDSERVYLNSKIAYYNAVAEVMKNYARLERLTGIGSLWKEDGDAK